MDILNHDYSGISSRGELYKIQSAHDYRGICTIFEFHNGIIKNPDLSNKVIERDLTYNLRSPRFKNFLNF